MLGRLRNALARALFVEREPRERAWSGPAPPRPAVRTEASSPERPLRSRREADAHRETAVIAAHRERALRRVAAAASDACEDWSQGLDVDEAMIRLRAELQSAAEFDV